MQFLELRRHSTRTPGTEHLSQAGVALARRVGSTMGPFARVMTSPSAWTFETALAMGFEVGARYAPVDLSESEWEALHLLMPPGTPFPVRSHVMNTDPLARRFAEALRSQWRAFVRHLPDGECMLVITHGGYIGNSAVACLPNAPHASWGDNFAHCEGIRLHYDGGGFADGAILRVPPDMPPPV